MYHWFDRPNWDVYLTYDTNESEAVTRIDDPHVYRIDANDYHQMRRNDNGVMWRIQEMINESYPRIRGDDQSQTLDLTGVSEVQYNFIEMADRDIARRAEEPMVDNSEALDSFLSEFAPREAV